MTEKFRKQTGKPYNIIPKSVFFSSFEWKKTLINFGENSSYDFKFFRNFDFVFKNQAFVKLQKNLTQTQYIN